MMLNIDCNNNITICQGDKGFVVFRCGNYLLKDGDRVEFDICELGTKIVVDEFTNGIASIDIQEHHTSCGKKTYIYTIRVITQEGVNETVIKGNFTII